MDIYFQIRGYFLSSHFSLIKIVSVKAVQCNKHSISFSLVLFFNIKVIFVATEAQSIIPMCYYKAMKFKRKASQDKSHLMERDQDYRNSVVHNPSSPEQVKAVQVNDHLEALSILQIRLCLYCFFQM